MPETHGNHADELLNQSVGCAGPGGDSDQPVHHEAEGSQLCPGTQGSQEWRVPYQPHGGPPCRSALGHPLAGTPPYILVQHYMIHAEIGKQLFSWQSQTAVFL